MASLLEQHTSLYGTEDVEYAQAMSGPYTDQSTSECWADVSSMRVTEVTGRIVAALKDGKITGYYRPMVAFGSETYLTEGIMALWQISQDIFYQDFLVDGRLSPISRFLLDKGYRATPYYTQVIDLTQTVETLRHNLRKSYHSLVNKQEQVEFCTVDVFQGIHEYVKQKVRPQESWDLQKKMNTLCAHDNGRCGVMFYVGPVWAYYASAAGDHTHAAIWACMLELKRRGVHWLEMGEQVYQGDEKAVNISRYKKGFGGETRVRLNLRKPTP